jgi:hypothetical protein
MATLLHGWYSAKSEEVVMEEVECSVPVYVDADGNHVSVTFVTRERELDYICKWDDLQYRGEVFKWHNEN